MKKSKVKELIKEAVEGGSTMTTDENGNKFWTLPNGKRHREDGPAIEWSNGDKSWWVNNKRHREDGPAVEYIGKYKAWYINGKRHREDGPAVEWDNGDKLWYFKGIRKS